jgi:hypothetical protein
VLNPFAAGGGPGARDFSSDLERTVAVQAGPDPQSVVVGFIDAASGRLVTLSVRALPGDLSSLADEARSHIVVLGSRYFPGQLPALADALRDYLRLAGGRLHPSVRDYLAEQSRLWVLDPTGGGAAGDLQALADGARSHIVVLGATLPGGQMRNAALPATVNLLELAAAASRVPLNLAVSVAAQLDAPATGPGPTRLLVSPSGEAVIVAWEDGNLLQYRESAGDRWTRVRGLALGPALSLEDAYRVLDERLRSR